MATKYLVSRKHRTVDSYNTPTIVGASGTYSDDNTVIVSGGGWGVNPDIVGVEGSPAGNGS